MSNNYFNPSNSVWPNGLKEDEEGYVTFYPLGTNKVDISTITWPEGDKLVSPFVYQNNKLVGFVDTKALTVSGSATTTMNYSHIEADFASISEGKLTVNAPNAVVKKFSWSIVDNGDDSGNNSGDDDVIVTLKYKGCKFVDNVKAVDPNYLTNDIVNGIWREGLEDLTSGKSMFYDCDTLITFTSNLSKMTNGRSMFSECNNLISFNCNDLSSLTDGKSMFAGCPNLKSFNSDLRSLTSGDSMFHSCSNLTSFAGDLRSLDYGSNMFNYCSNLTSFTSDLRNLGSATNMFSYCKLDASSIKNIIDTIGTNYFSIVIGMGCNNTTNDKKLFAQEVGYPDMNSLIAAIEDKGWFVTAQYNGRPTTTYSLRMLSEDTLPVFVKLEETEEYATHTSEDGSKKYMLNYFHETTGSTEGYTQFNSLEEAIEQFNIKPIERN